MSKKNKKHFNGAWDQLFEDWDDGTIFEPKKKKGKKHRFADEEVHSHADETKVKGEKKEEKKEKKESANSKTDYFKIPNKPTLLNYPQRCYTEVEMNMKDPNLSFLHAFKYDDADTPEKAGLNRYVDLSLAYMTAIVKGNEGDEAKLENEMRDFLGGAQFERYYGRISKEIKDLMKKQKNDKLNALKEAAGL